MHKIGHVFSVRAGHAFFFIMRPSVYTNVSDLGKKFCLAIHCVKDCYVSVNVEGYN